MSADKVREDRLRRACERRGLVLRRNRRRDPDAVDFGFYRIVDRKTKRAARGTPPAGFPDLATVEQWLLATSRRPVIEEAAA